MKKYLITTLVALSAALLCSWNAAGQTLTSPDGNLSMTFGLSAEGVPHYDLIYKGKTVVAESRLGYSLKPDYAFDKDFEIIGTSTDASDSIWHPVLGENKDIRDNHKELFVAMRQKNTGWLLNLRFRLFDDGLGFRYEFPVQSELRHVIVKEESTEFRLSGDHKAFWIPSDYDTNEFQITTSKLSEVI